MPTYYVGSGGNDGNAGTSWAQRKLTLNGAEDIPVAAGDTVYVAPGVYRELLTCDVSGSSGSLISYIGDYTGANTDGVGGIVRITGSDNDTTKTRAYAITANNKDYRSFSGFVIDMFTQQGIVSSGGSDYWTLEKLYICNGNSSGIYVDGASVGWTIQDVYIALQQQRAAIDFYHSSAVDDTNHTIQRVIVNGGQYGVKVNANINQITVKNSVFANLASHAVRCLATLTAGKFNYVYNSIITQCTVGVQAATLGDLVEDYNTFLENITDRASVNTGANSNAYPALFDTRWFFEMVNGGNMVTPWDLASYSQLVNVAGSSPPAADMRGTTIIGAAREWGPLEYDPDLDIEAGSGGGGGPIVGSRIVRAV